MASKLLVDLEKGLKLLKNHIKEHRDVFVVKLNKKEKVSTFKLFSLTYTIIHRRLHTLKTHLDYTGQF
ncbi:hypothetical protein K443DRAFT_7185 [Laccaria amethystina LaAM-08-1]|uniref:Uncharacterized protein n=1 Tax=Laccaria amethystina LaAM-08-1 TaxID=1095629 RepID=A0A0C9XZ31_9AGAR|nr:hypothetical protein K443DRAFT_7185 [Laccaria amethystina LaAM-08-1]